MDAETWLNANKAIELGFADDILFKDNEPTGVTVGEASFAFSRRAVTNSLLNKLTAKKPTNKGVPVAQFDKRLELLKTKGEM